MFEYGVVPKKLGCNSSDRSKFYRLIEASLYGGISSVITFTAWLPSATKWWCEESIPRHGIGTSRKPHDTWSDQNDSVGSWLVQTLDHRIDQLRSSDYMRHANDRRNKLDQTMKFAVNCLVHVKPCLIKQPVESSSRRVGAIGWSRICTWARLSSGFGSSSVGSNWPCQQEKIALATAKI